MNALTIEYDGTEQSLDALGFTMPRLTLRSRAAGSLELYAYGADPAVQAVTPTIPYGGEIIFKVDGVVWFVGKRRDLNGIARGDQRNVTLVFKDAWDSLQRTTYQMQWTEFGSSSTTYSPRCFLFQNLGNSTTPWTQWQTKDQIIDAINFAKNQCNIAIQAGTIDPIMYQPVYPCYSPKCSDVILLALTSVPDAITWFDYTTVDGDGNPLPTLHVRQRQNCTAVNLPYADGSKHLSTNIRSREDLQVPQVVFNYQATDLVDNVTQVEWATDVYPIGSTGLAENACVEAIDLRGSVYKDAYGTVVAETFDCTTAAYWQDKIPSLDDATVASLALVDTTINGGSGHPLGITVTDYDGNPISLATYPRELKSGQIAPWMLDSSNVPIVCKEAIITAHVKYTKNHPVATGLKTDDVTDHIVTTRVHLTNSVAGKITYKAQASGSAAEEPLPNLAYLFWCACNNVAVNIVGGVVTPPGTAPSITNAYNLQWEGQHVIVENSISTYYTPFNTINLTGGATNWASMKAAVAEIEYDFFNGKTTISFGPNKKLSARQFFSQMMMFRTRMSFDNPNVRSTGADPSGAGTTLGQQTRVQDTTNAAPAAKQTDSVAAPPAGGTSAGAQTGSTRDMASNGGQWTLGTYIAGVLQNSGSSTPYNSVELSLNDLAAALGSGIFADIKFRAVPITDSECGEWYFIVPCSAPIAGIPPTAFFP